MRQPALIRNNVVSAEKVAKNFGIPLSRVRTIEKVLKKSRQEKAVRAKAGKKRSASTTK